MKLISCKIENFGILHERELHFDAGLNVLREDNGQGKSTLAAFIKAMLYGMPVTRKTDLEENERRRYQPWQGGNYGGSLTFEAKGKIYRTERFFSEKGKKDIFHLYDEKSGLQTTDFSEHLGEELFGIDAAAYERTAFIPQKLISGGIDNTSIHAKLNGLIDVGADINDFERAMTAINKGRQELRRQSGNGILPELEETMADLKRRISDCERAEGQRDAADEKADALECAAEKLRRVETDALRLWELKKAVSEDERRCSTYSAWFPKGKLPEKEQISEIRVLEDEIRQESALISGEDEPLSVLPAGMLPERETLQTWDEAIFGLARNEMRLSALQKEMTQISALIGDDRLPDSDTLAVHRALFDGLTEKKKNAAILRRRAEQKKKEYRKKRRIFGILSCSGMICIGIALIIFAVLEKIKMLGILPSALGLFFLAVGMIVQSKISAKTVGEAEREAYAEEQDFAEDCGAITDFLKSYMGSEAVFDVDNAETAILFDRLADACKKRRDTEISLQSNRRQQEFLLIENRRFFENLQEYSALCQRLQIPETGDRLEDMLRLKERIHRMREAEKIQKSNAERRERLNALKERLASRMAQYRLPADDPALNEIPSQAGRLSRAVMLADACRASLAQKKAECAALENKIRTAYRQAEETFQTYLAEHALSADGMMLSELLPAVPFDDDAASAAKEALRELTEQRTRCLQDAEHFSADAERKTELIEQLDDAKRQYAQTEHRYEVITLAGKYLEEAKNSLSTRYLDRMQDRFRAYYAMLCVEGDEKDRLTLDASLCCQTEVYGERRSQETLSRGYRDLLNFCLRMALVDTLYAGEEAPFLLLDDPFVNLDDKKLKEAKTLLRKTAEKYQILYFTCHESRC